MFGAREAAWPLIRTEMGLTYAQIGVLLAVPAVVGHVLEPAVGVLGDVWDRRTLILGGGVLFAVSVALVAASPGFLPLLAAFCIGHPASGAFVSLPQATLMDAAPSRREQNMARWNFAGYVGALSGTLAVGGVGEGWNRLARAVRGTDGRFAPGFGRRLEADRAVCPESAQAAAWRGDHAGDCRGGRVAAPAGRRPVAGAA